MENQVVSGHVIDCEPWAVDKSKWRGLGVFGAGRMVWCIFNLQNPDNQNRANPGSPWKPSPDKVPITSFSILSCGEEFEEGGSCWDGALKCDLVHKAATLWNIMIHKWFKNDTKGFGKFGPLTEGQGVSKLNSEPKFQTFEVQTSIQCQSSRAVLGKGLKLQR